MASSPDQKNKPKIHREECKDWCRKHIGSEWWVEPYKLKNLAKAKEALLVVVPDQKNNDEIDYKDLYLKEVANSKQLEKMLKKECDDNKILKHRVKFDSHIYYGAVVSRYELDEMIGDNCTDKEWLKARDILEQDFEPSENIMLEGREMLMESFSKAK